MPNVATALANALNPLARFLGRKPRHQAPPSPPEPEELTTLNRILMLVVRRPATQENFRVMTNQMSPEAALVRTRREIQRGEALEAQVLLTDGYLLRMDVEVAWVLRDDGSYLGRLSLKPSPEGRARLEAYVRKLAVD